MKKCDDCRQKRPDVKYDRGNHRSLCDRCWFGTEPRYRRCQEREAPREGE